jgi:hypothetical protein
MDNIVRLQPRLRPVPTFTTNHTVLHPQSNAYGFDPVEEVRERVEITAGLRKTYAVRVDAAIWAEFYSATLAIRCAEHLRGLDRLGCLHAPQPETARAMFKASVEEIVK